MIKLNDLLTDFVTKELLKEIDIFIADFKPDVQEVFRLKLYGELSFKEIAELQSVKEEKVKAQYYRLLDRVRKEFNYEEFKS